MRQSYFYSKFKCTVANLGRAIYFINKLLFRNQQKSDRFSDMNHITRIRLI